MYITRNKEKLQFRLIPYYDGGFFIALNIKGQGLEDILACTYYDFRAAVKLLKHHRDNIKTHDDFRDILRTTKRFKRCILKNGTNEYTKTS